MRAQAEGHGVSAGPVGDWTATHKTVLRVGCVALAALIFVFVGQPTVGLAVLLVVLLLVALGVIELLGGGRPPEQQAAAEGVSPARPGTDVTVRNRP